MNSLSLHSVQYSIHHKPAVLENHIQWQIALVNTLRGDLQILTHLLAQSQVITFQHPVTFGQCQCVAVGHQAHGARLEEYDHAIRRGVVFDEIVGFDAIGVKRPVDFPAAAQVGVGIQPGIVSKENCNQQQASMELLFAGWFSGFRPLCQASL